VESPSLEIFQPRLDAVLCILLWVTLLGQGVGLGDPQRALPTPTMLGFCDLTCIWPFACFITRTCNGLFVTAFNNQDLFCMRHNVDYTENTITIYTLSTPRLGCHCHLHHSLANAVPSRRGRMNLVVISKPGEQSSLFPGLPTRSSSLSKELFNHRIIKAAKGL